MEIKVNGLEGIRVQQTEAEREFWKLYKRLRKKYHLTMHLSASVYEKRDDSIEIWRDEDGKRAETVCRIKREDIEECYEIAVLDLKFYEKRMQEREDRGQEIQEERIWKTCSRSQ
ncbi:MAG: hypothetical protein HDQ96_04675 [Lachnospiraceae bacterium]|nr:hypothetical protein [Lachnospiraceae bacterium]